MSKRKQEVVKSEETESRDAHLLEGIEQAKASSRRTHLIALSKVVNRAFTGWTIKTQR